MNAFIKKLNILAVSALSAGIIFCCGFTFRLPVGVQINGVDVGGMTRSAAVAAVRRSIEEELGAKRLKVIGERREYVFAYPEISYKDDLNSLVKNVKKGEKYTAEVRYYLCGLEAVASAICRNERVLKEEPRAIFRTSGAPFDYAEGRDGKEADPIALKTDILNALKGGFEEVRVRSFPVRRSRTLSDVKSETVLLGRYTTYFDGTNINRSNNIRLAAALINGVTIESGQTFSFNSAVGARLPERGFLPAKIIENGEYVEGVGGGVCQVSSTLYNAALLAGMNVTEHHAHSLAVGYVAPSRDAMVSGSSCDLKFVNKTPRTAYIRASSGENSVTFEIYGKSDGFKYSLESAVTEIIPPPEEECSDPALARDGKEGVKSELYLLTEFGGYVKRVRLRRDSYMPISRLTPTPQPEPQLNNTPEPHVGRSKQFPLHQI